MIDTVADFVINQYPIILIGYVIGGIVYALTRWFIRLYKVRQVILNIDFEETLKNDPRRIGSERLPPTPLEELILLKKKEIARKYFDGYSYPPQVSENKGMLFSWAVAWPFLIIWNMIADIATESWKWVYNRISQTIQNLSNKIMP